MNCKALKTVSYNSLLEAHRKDEEKSNTYDIQVQIQFIKRNVTMIDIIGMFNVFSIPIIKFELEKINDKTMLAKIEGEISNPAKLGFLFSDLQKNHQGIEIVSKHLV